MILSWLPYFCIIKVLTAQEGAPPAEGSTGSIDVKSPTAKTVICSFRRNMQDDNPLITNLEADKLPPECGAIMYDRFSVDATSLFNVDYESLKLATDARPVIVALNRENGYSGWADILTPDGNQAEAKLLCDFAKNNNIKGFVVSQLAPQSPTDTVNLNISQYIVPYLKQLKCSDDFIIGVSIRSYSSLIKSTCIYDFAKMNEFVDFYRIFTYYLNTCWTDIYNGRVPLEIREHGDSYLLSMKEVTEFLKQSQIKLENIYYTIEMGPFDNDPTFNYNSNTQVCDGSLNISNSCIQNTNDYYEKGKYVKSENAGLNIKYVELDDIDNRCGCGEFVAFNNVIAGYNDGQAIPCAKLDVQCAQT